MSTIYLNNPSKPIRPPHSNDCNGHNTSISVGGNGHWVGDGCQCDDINPETPIDFIASLLMLSAFIIIVKQKTKRTIRRRFYQPLGKYF